MGKTEHRMAPGAPSELGDWLTSTNKQTRLLGRGIASGWTQTAVDWCMAELERGTPPPEVLDALSLQFVEVAAALAAACFTKDGDALARDLMKNRIDDRFVPHVAMTRAAIAKAGRRS